MANGWTTTEDNFCDRWLLCSYYAERKKRTASQKKSSSNATSAQRHCLAQDSSVSPTSTVQTLGMWKNGSGGTVEHSESTAITHEAKGRSNETNGSSNYTPQDNQLNWLSLDTRRQVSRLVMFYKIVQQSVALALTNEIVLFNTITRGHNMRYRTPFSRVDVHKNSFFQ